MDLDVFQQVVLPLIIMIIWAIAGTRGRKKKRAAAGSDQAPGRQSPLSPEESEAPQGEVESSPAEEQPGPVVDRPRPTQETHEPSRRTGTGAFRDPRQAIRDKIAEISAQKRRMLIENKAALAARLSKEKPPGDGPDRQDSLEEAVQARPVEATNLEESAQAAVATASAQAPSSATASPRSPFLSRRPDDLARAVVWSEILGKPLALRDE